MEVESLNESTLGQSNKFDEGNAGWADVFHKILKTNKPKKKKTLVLSRAKKLTDVVPGEVTKPSPDGGDPEVENKDVSQKTNHQQTIVELSSKKREKTPSVLRLKPSISDRGRERTLQKIATKGVVQLFNAVRQQQTELEKKLVEAGPLERKREQVLKSIDKRAFLDVLMGGSKSIPVNNNEIETKNEDKNETKVWSVLRDDFVMGAKMKDWDKESLSSEDSSEAEDMESD